jgi:hypothetical protein
LKLEIRTALAVPVLMFFGLRSIKCERVLERVSQIVSRQISVSAALSTLLNIV